jgi:hypothetical protein
MLSVLVCLPNGLHYQIEDTDENYYVLCPVYCVAAKGNKRARPMLENESSVTQRSTTEGQQQ